MATHCFRVEGVKVGLGRFGERRGKRRGIGKMPSTLPEKEGGTIEYMRPKSPLQKRCEALRRELDAEARKTSLGSPMI